MTRRFSIVAMLALLLGALSPVHALTYSRNSDEGPDENAILATGAIERDEAFRFQTYLSKLPVKQNTVLYLNSTGGSVQGSIAMGRIVYGARIKTFVTTAGARCNSACTNIFLAGRDRGTGKPFRVKGTANGLGFHNFVPILEDKPYTEVDFARVMSNAQNTIFELANYYQEIDANLELLGFGLKQKDIYFLPNEDALRYGIHVLDTNTNELVRYETFIRFLKP